MIENSLCKECGACMAVCPVGAISNEQKNGFTHPIINLDKCINCKLCDYACDLASNNVFKKSIKQKSYVARSKEPDYFMTSRSGGFFRTISEFYVRKYSAVVYGATVSGKKVDYERVDEVSRLNVFSGSKYVWCDHRKQLYNVAKDLQDSKIVIVSGLPCQISGVISFLKIKKIDSSKLITIDIVCHGCPSKKVFDDYIDFQCRRYNDKLIEFQFRNKKDFGWSPHIETLYFQNKKVYSDIWTRTFYSHYALRNSCFSCEYKSTNRVGDISLADAWNIEKTDSCLNDDKGANLVLLNSEKGIKIFDEIRNEFNYFETDLFDFMQPALKKSVDKPAKYDLFWSDYSKNGYKYVLKRYIHYGIKEKCKFFIKKKIYSKNKSK